MSIENSVRLIGNLGADVEVKYTQGGVAVGTTRIATTRRYTKDGERKEETSWHRLKFFGKLAEIAGEHLRKGSKIAIEGSIRYGEYEKDGVKHYTSDIVADQMTFLDSKPEGSAGTGGSRGGAPRRERPAPATAPADDEFADDDLPSIGWGRF